MTTASPPRENLVRALRPAVEVRAAGDGGMPTLVGRFAVFQTWTEISSAWEGNFLERVAPGAFRKTFKENIGSIRALFQHGMDPQVGDKPLGPIDVLREDKTGAYYEVPLLDTSYNRDIVPGLEAGLYGASFRFRVLREQLVERPEPSAYNPRGLPERTLQEVQVMEFGPVTFPAYADASAGVRSMTDEFIVGRLARDPAILTRLGEAFAAAHPASPDGEEQRMDVEDLDTLAQMISLGADYVAEQDEPDDEPNAQVMQDVLKMLQGLTAVEVQEDEPEEPEGEAGRSSKPGEQDEEQNTAPSTPDADRSVTSGTSAAPESWVRGTQPKPIRKGWL